MKHIDIYTDGACSGNPGPGGYGCILRYHNTTKELSAGYRLTTNNRMEVLSAVVGLSALREPCEVTLYSDSKYLVDSITKGWVYKWQKNNWVKPDKKRAINVDLWKQLLYLLDKHTVAFIWLKGHDGHPENERCDAIARNAAINAVDIDIVYETEVL